MNDDGGGSLPDETVSGSPASMGIGLLCASSSLSGEVRLTVGTALKGVADKLVLDARRPAVSGHVARAGGLDLVLVQPSS